MLRISKTILILVLFFIIVFKDIKAHFIQYSKKISSDDTYLLSWGIDEDAGLIRIQLDVKTVGWVGFGLSPNGLMANSDIYMGYIQNDGKANVSDRFATYHGLPGLDSEQGSTSDIFDIDGSVTNGRTKISFTRKLNTNDKNDIEIVKGKTLSLIFSYRANGNPDSENGVFNKHTFYYADQIILFPYNGQSITPKSLADKYSNDPDILVMPIVNNKYMLSSSDKVSYSMMVFDVRSAMREKLKMSSDSELPITHAIGFEPILDNYDHVHHILLYNCDLDSYNITLITGFTNQMPYICNTYVAMYFKGQGYTELPKEVGYIWGSYDTKYVVLHIHYVNPFLVSNVIDSSGFNIFFTKKLRQYDLALAQYGPVQRSHGLMIPPGKTSYVQNFGCSKDCLNKFQSDGIKVVSFLLHGHDLLRKIRVEVTDIFGIKDTTTFRNDNFDFDHQELITLKTPYEIKNNYNINIFCDYDSSSRSSYTYSGGDFEDEMCCILLYYYPRKNGPAFCLDKTLSDSNMICLAPPKINTEGIQRSDSFRILINSVGSIIIYILFYML